MPMLHKLVCLVTSLLIAIVAAAPLTNALAAERNASTFASKASGRVALVIGNSDYPSGALDNPKNDARAMHAILEERLGFKAELVLDASKSQIDQAMKRFARAAEGADAALVFYAGHGLQVGGYNYLVPIDAKPQNERDLKREMIKMDDIIDDMATAKVKLVFWDACRDNPLARSFTRGGPRGMAAPVETAGTLISFATKHGNTASDGNSNHSPYTQALLAELQAPQGVEIEQLLRKVQQGVKKSTKGVQEPWRYGSLDGDFYLIQGPVNISINPPSPPSPPSARDPETETWTVAERANSLAGYEMYLEAFPRGRYATAARIALNALKSTSPPETKASISASIAAASVKAEMRPGSVFKDCADCPDMVVLPSSGGGAATMAMGQAEVTQGQWQAVMGNNPSSFQQCGTDCPVENVNWDDAQVFIQKLNTKTGKTYRLPAEQEWAYACLGGQQTEYCGSYSVDAVAWYDGNSGSTTHRVRTKQANGFGLYDMSGNVWEWTDSCWEGDCGQRAVRGGSWDDIPADARAALCGRNDTTLRLYLIGFRLARMLP
ncbi:MAG: caspase family protein [Rhodoferax sp.]|nr:caspase family protein [Rhodoferax sp.]